MMPLILQSINKPTLGWAHVECGCVSLSAGALHETETDVEVDDGREGSSRVQRSSSGQPDQRYLTADGSAEGQHPPEWHAALKNQAGEQEGTQPPGGAQTAERATKDATELHMQDAGSYADGGIVPGIPVNPNLQHRHRPPRGAHAE